MTTHSQLTAAKIRKKISHPVVDADGHWLEFGPTIKAALKRIGGQALRGYTLFSEQMEQDLDMSVAERKAQRIGQQGFWAVPTKNTIDRATAMMPKLLYERMDELGLDFCILYPTAGLGLPRLTDPHQRKAACRAFNIFVAEHFSAFSDRMTPVTAIPTYTPEEAIEELEFVKYELGLKAVMLGSMNRHRVPALPEESLPNRFTIWRDVLALDSDYDYDPVWDCCQQLGFSPTFHTGGRGYGLRISPSNFVYNHIGHFASTSEAVCKALFLGGVTRRFPQLNFGFQEGGVGWACQLFADLVEHWETRNKSALEAVDPANIDVQAMVELAKTYGDSAMVDALSDPATLVDTAAPATTSTGRIENIDDFSACKIEQAHDISALFVDRFYFGCESEDKMNAWAFSARNNPFCTRLNAMFGSDIGHFDVMDMGDVLPGAYELVESGLMNDTDFYDFTFANAVRFWGKTNPAFFADTVVADAAKNVLK